MTIASTARKAGPLLGTGTQTAFPFTFKVFADGDLLVTRANALGLETTLVLDVDYTVTLNSNQETSPGGTVTLATAPAVGEKLAIVGDVDYDQPLDLPSGGNFSPLALENQLDRMTMQIQQLREIVGRSVRTPVTVAGVSTTLPAPASNALVGWNENETALQNFPLSEIATALAYVSYRYDTFVGDGVQTVFTLGADPVNLGNIDVSLDGLTTVPGVDHTIVGAALVFTVPPGNGVQILARYGQGVTGGFGGDAIDIHFQPAGVGSVELSVESKLRESVSVKDFGAVGDGVVDDTDAIQAARAANPGKELYFPSGTYLTASVAVSTAGGVRLRGENKYNTTLKLLSGLNDHVISFVTGAAACSISDITIDQNSAGKSGGHGLRLGGVDGLTMRNIRIKSCYSYGIGFQAGTNKNVTIDGFEIFDCGQDGIDVKDYDLANENIIITNGVIYDYGKNAAGQVGFDIRGPANVSNVEVFAQNPNTRGFRLRVSSVQGRAGSGAVNNIRVRNLDATTYGFNVEGASNKNLTISNIVVENGMIGVIGGSGGIYRGIVGSGATATESLSIPGSENDIDGLIIDGANRGIDFEPGGSNNSVRGFNIKNVTGTEAIRIQSTANENTFADGFVQDGKLISDSGTETTIRDVKNWKTKSNILSGAALVDAVGVFAITVNPGLKMPPRLQDIQISIVQTATTPNDYEIAFFRAEGTPSSTNLSIRYRVVTASATPGAAVNFAVSIRAKNA